MKHILILGGDGYLGWPTAMHFSDLGFNVTVVDNYMRRDAIREINATELFPLPTLQKRAQIWQELTGKEIRVKIADLSEPSVMGELFSDKVQYSWSLTDDPWGMPETAIHYAEQPSAPYSLYGAQQADRTLINNLRVTNNLIWAVKDRAPDCHIVKLGTMGEYGTPNIDIEEGWLDIEHKGRKDRFLFPRQAGSLYHTTKIMDTDLLWFAVRTWGLKVTDLMQGPVYGVDTKQTKIDPRLRPIFNYDEVFGTVINRFVVQAVVGYPLTVYGAGGQTRGYLNIIDTLQCVEKATLNPASDGELRIFNQIMETFSVNELANIIAEHGKTRGHKVEVRSIENPRKEAEEHYYNPTYHKLIELGVKPHLLGPESLDSMFEVVEEYRDRIDTDSIFRGVKW